MLSQRAKNVHSKHFLFVFLLLLRRQLAWAISFKDAFSFQVYFGDTFGLIDDHEVRVSVVPHLVGKIYVFVLNRLFQNETCLCCC